MSWGVRRWLLVCGVAAAAWVVSGEAWGQTIVDNPTGASAVGDGGPDGLTFEVGDWAITFGGYARVIYRHVEQPDESGLNFIGENNGFVMGDARLGVLVRYDERLTIKIQFDGTGDDRGSINDTVGAQRVRLRDAFAAYSFGDYATVLAGQAKPPINVESFLATRDLVFVSRSLVSNGVRAGEGRQVLGTEGFGRSREVGVALLSGVMDFGSPVGVAYHLAVTNGNAASETRNDNNAFAYYGRGEVHLRDRILGRRGDEGVNSLLVVGGSVAYNENTPAQFPSPDLLEQQDLTWAVDLHFQAFGVDVLAQWLERTREFPELAQDAQTSRGLLAQVAYRLPIEWLALQLGYRFATLDPFTEDGTSAINSDDELMYHTVGVGYTPPGVPVDLKFNYTITSEQGSSAINNDLIEGLVQVIF